MEEVLPGGRVRVNGQVLLNLSSNDYLGLSLDPRLIAAAQARRGPLGGGGRGLPPGDGPPGPAPGGGRAAGGLQRDRRPRSIFSTGYMANLGVIAALSGPGDTVFCDKLNHASIYDGIKLSGAALHRFPHRDLNRLEELLHKARRQAAPDHHRLGLFGGRRPGPPGGTWWP